MLEILERLIIRWSLKRVKRLPKGLSFGELEKYGIADIIINEHTKEKMYVL